MWVGKARKILTRVGLGGCLIIVNPAAKAAENGAPIRIVTATFGPLGGDRPLSFAPQLQEICGPNSDSCEVFCSRALIQPKRAGWSLPFQAAPVCRVIYRCGEAKTKVSSADLDEPIRLQCVERGVHELVQGADSRP